MPRAIAIETSGRIGSIAVVDSSRIIAEETFPHGLAHAAQVVSILDRHVRAAGWMPRDVEHLYLSIGPGSFTGLRIAVTLAKAMALATGVKIAAVPSTRVLVENAPPDAAQVIIVLDAKRGQIFTARFARSADGWTEIEAPHVDTLAAALARAPRPVHLLGEGIPLHRQFIDPADPDIIISPESSWRARAAAVALIGARLAAAGQFADPFTLAPLYIRLPEAEEKLLTPAPSTPSAAPRSNRR